MAAETTMEAVMTAEATTAVVTPAAMMVEVTMVAATVADASGDRYRWRRRR